MHFLDRSSCFRDPAYAIERPGGERVSGGTGVGIAAPSIPLDIGSRDLGTGAAETAETLVSEGESLAAGAEDAFGLDAAFRRRVLPAVRFLFERYWRGRRSRARDTAPPPPPP